MKDEHGFAAFVAFRSGGDPPPKAKTGLRDAAIGAMVGVGFGMLGLGAVADMGASRFGVSPLVVTGMYVALCMLLGVLVVGGWMRPLARKTVSDLLKEREVRERVEIDRLRGRPRVRIAELTGSGQRAVGKVRVLEAPSGLPDGVAVSLAEGRHAGRFVIEDDSGTALVDDDMVELFFEERGQPVLEAQMWVEISGPGHRGAVSGATRGYRGGEDGFVFSGSPEEKVEIICLAQPPNEQIG